MTAESLALTLQEYALAWWASLDDVSAGWWVVAGLAIACWLVQFWFDITWFGPLARYKRDVYPASLAVQPTDRSGLQQPVSVIICSRNRAADTLALVDQISPQMAPDDELIIVDDRSDEAEYDLLLTASRRSGVSVIEPAWAGEHGEEEPTDTSHLIGQGRGFRLVRVRQTPEHVSPKKFALTLGLKAASHDWVVLTDADCLPRTSEWLSRMRAPLGYEGISMVLGIAPYRRGQGFVSLVTQIETLMTAACYAGAALAGQAYMGVGRNLAYSRRLFFSLQGFTGHQHLLGGDDDLIVNAWARRYPAQIALVLAPEAHTLSAPETTFGDYYRQKRRHVSASRYYHRSDQIRLGLLAVTQGGHFALGVALLTHPVLWLPALAGLLSRLVTRAWLFKRVSERLGAPLSLAQCLIIDIWIPLYHLLIGAPALLAKKITTWK